MSKITTEDFISRARKIHGDKYDYSLVDYVKSKANVKIICPKHGVFEQRASHHWGGVGCKKCWGDRKGDATRMGKDKFINRAKEIHGEKFDYSLVEYVNANTKVKIICPTHGVFEQTPSGHLLGRDCRQCGIIKCSSSQTFTLEDFIKKSKEVHGDTYDYSDVQYVTSQEKVNIICPKHGTFRQIPNKHLMGQRCPKCAGQISKAEQEIFEFIEKRIECKQSECEVIKPMELDIYIPKLKIGIEHHGLYYHSDKFKDKNSHFEKLNCCNEKGIRLVQIFEDEWRDKTEICKSRLLNLIGKTPNKIFARKCKIKDVSPKDARLFLEQNHIQGNVSAKVKLGLYFNDELVSLMTFGNLRKNLGQESKEDAYELLRFCNKLNTNVIGGASKLLKHFEKVYRPKEIISYADRRWSDGNLYKQLGFTFEHMSRPNYFYIKGEIRENRFKYRKSELVKYGFDSNKSEKQIMEEQGFFRIYDCGAIRFVKKF